MAELIKVLFRVCTGVGHEPYIKWDPDPPMGKGIFWQGPSPSLLKSVGNNMECNRYSQPFSVGGRSYDLWYYINVIIIIIRSIAAFCCQYCSNLLH